MSEPLPPPWRAYPRLRGATRSAPAVLSALQGLSPLARGNRCHQERPGHGPGPIPACAGQPRTGRERGAAVGAYPRLRGATHLRFNIIYKPLGLSPLARGNRASRLDGRGAQGPIPACAGQPLAISQRLGHGHAEGLSPLARGNPVGLHAPVLRLGPIPACAGQPRIRTSFLTIIRAYPRLRGATVINDANVLRATGLSPLARGNRMGAILIDVGAGPIPACAGQPAPDPERAGTKGAYPRLRGATGYAGIPHGLDQGLSPLARGNPSNCRWDGGKQGAYPRLRGATYMLES